MGPTGAGKSSILLKLNYPETIIDPTNYNPTIACDFVMIRGPRPDLLPTNTNVSQRGLRIACFDTSGAERYAIINSSFLRHTHGIIFVIDSSPRDGQTREQFIDEARRSLLRVISQYANNVQDQPLLVFVNKQDCAGARMTAEEVIESLDLEDMFATDKGVGGDGGERRWFVQEASALRGEGIAMGFAWLLAQMEDRRRTNPAL
jgi:GTPase SAR1 family protein